MLCPHVLLIGLHGGGEGFLRAGIVAGTKKDMARHVDHVSRRWSKAAENFGALKGLLRVWTCLYRMNPVMVRRGVFRILFQHDLKYRQSLFLPRAGLIVIVVAIGKRVRQKNSRLH